MHEPLPEWAAKYIGIPFEYRGRSVQGADCWGIVRMIYKEVFSIKLPDYSKSYILNTKLRTLQSAIYQHRQEFFERINENDVRLDDGICVLLLVRGLPVHIGFYIGMESGKRAIIHTTESRGHSYREFLEGKDLEHAEPAFYRVRRNG